MHSIVPIMMSGISDGKIVSKECCLILLVPPHPAEQTEQALAPHRA
jgi:hypothetical protein